MITLHRTFAMASLLALVLLASCVVRLPPAMYTSLEKYAVDDGSDVIFSVNVYNSPTSVSCFSGNVVLSNTSGDTWSGTADYTNDLLNSPGTNTVICTAVNSAGTTISNVGFIELIPNVAPNLVMLSTRSICGNDGDLEINQPLVNFTSSTYLSGASFSLTHGTLPAGLAIDPSNGNLIGTTDAGDFNPSPLKMTATTMAGSDESTTFTIDINEAACP